jgi:hypothetical protein
MPNCELVAQLVEQRPFKAWVLGSNPSELTTLDPQGHPSEILMTNHSRN